MRRNPDHTLVTKPLHKFQILTHDISHRNSAFEDTLVCIYELVEVYTDKGSPLIALEFCNWSHINCFDKRYDTGVSRLLLTDRHPHKRQLSNKNWDLLYDAHTNCLGSSVLSDRYWIDLTTDTIDTMIKDDSYTEVPETFSGDHLLIYYKGTSPVHIVRFDVKSNGYNHKPGCNQPIFCSDDNARFGYRYDSKKRFAIV